MFYSRCCFIYRCVFYVRAGVTINCCLSLSLSRYSLYPVSLSFSSFTRPTLSRKVPPCEPGPAQGFSLLKGTFSCHCADLGVLAPGF